jgi:RecJ-like exonuclease
LPDAKQGDLTSLEASASDAAKLISELAREGSRIHVLTHFDSDGLASAGILGTALHRLDASIHMRAIDSLDEKALSQLPLDNIELAIITDMGSGMLEQLSSKAEKAGKPVVVLDHHQPVGQPNGKIIHVNPHLFGFDGAREISGAGVAYLVARAIDARNVDLSALAVVGALGDMQDRGEKRSLSGLNTIIAEDGERAGCLKLYTDLVLYGRETRPIHRALAYTSNPFLPGLSGQEDRCLALVTSAGIVVKQDERWRTLADLSDEEKKSLLSAVIQEVSSKGVAGKVALNLIGTVYVLPREERGMPTRDAREFSSLLNACGRMNRQGLALSICLGERGRAMDEAQEVLSEYRKNIAQYLSWATETRERIEELRSVYIVHGEGTIDENMTGSISTILVSSGIFDPMKAVLVLARKSEGDLKISSRGTEQLVMSGVNLGKIMQELTWKYGGTGGGHDIAAGGSVPADREREFLEELDREITSALEARDEGKDSAGSR